MEEKGDDDISKLGALDLVSEKLFRLTRSCQGEKVNALTISTNGQAKRSIRMSIFSTTSLERYLRMESI